MGAPSAQHTLASDRAGQGGRISEMRGDTAALPVVALDWKQPDARLQRMALGTAAYSLSRKPHSHGNEGFLPLTVAGMHLADIE